jgi:arylsulfatase A-like enzyme/Flp pilus assembly protein TadD
LLISLDTLRADSLGCYGCRDVQTPVIDALASAGVRFTDAMAPAPVTLPSHSTIMTGLYPPRHGVRDNGKFKLGDKHQALAEHLKTAGYSTAAFVAAFVLDNRYGLKQGFDVYDDQMADSRRHTCMPGGMPQRPGDIVTDSALKWLTTTTEQEPNTPFFAWIHLFDAHSPYEPPEPYATTYQKKQYLGEIAFIDEQVGRIVSFLRDRSLLEDTLIVIVGDHGEGLGEHNEDTHSRLIYEATMRVPMIWHCPGVLGETRVVDDRVVSVADVTPTILDLLEIEATAKMDGLSLLDRRPPKDRAVYIETLAPQLNHGWSPLFGLRRLKDKFIEAPTPEYYDLENDPKELSNRYTTFNEEAIELEKSLADLREKFDAEITDEDSLMPTDFEAAKKLAALGYVVTTIGGTRKEPADPKDMMPLLRKTMTAMGHAKNGRSAESTALYREVVNETPEDGTAWAGLSGALGQQGKTDEAIAAILKATSLQPEQRHWIYLARLQMLKGDDEACRTSLEQAKLVVPGDGEIPLLHGERLLRMKKYEEAMNFAEQAREVDPSRISVSAYILDGQALIGLGEFEKARHAYNQALYFDPHDLRALDELAGLDEQTNDYLRALPSRRKLLELRPNSMLYTNKLSALYFKLDRADDAIATQRSFAERQSESSAAQGNLANSLMSANRIEEAIDVYRQAIRLNPQYAIARYNLAGALEKIKDVDAAIEQCREALKVQSDFAPARLRLLVLLTESGQLDGAIAELKNAARQGLINWSDLVSEPKLEKLVKDPRFAALRDSSGLQTN